ncbi:MAG TPA: DivIVA domain-containing protein [Candidatus Dormibacteraeota bacterium]|nr:DivIVA domain-containing protein [Candidatus Dormibacteraeota bacterium]
MNRITIVDIQHKTFKKAIQGYAREDVDQYLDEIIESLEDEGQERAALEAQLLDLKERISHFKAMEESLQNTLLLAQRTADEVKAAAHKEADLIIRQARIEAEKEVATLRHQIDEAHRERQQALGEREKARNELRSLLLTHLSLIEERVVPSAEAAPSSNGVASARASEPAAPEAPGEPAREHLHLGLLEDPAVGA